MYYANHYLHWWDEDRERFTTVEEEILTDFGGIVFWFDCLMDKYRGGYKFWLCRSMHDAPSWVHALYERRMRDRDE